MSINTIPPLLIRCQYKEIRDQSRERAEEIQRKREDNVCWDVQQIIHTKTGNKGDGRTDFELKNANVHSIMGPVECMKSDKIFPDRETLKTK